MRSLVCAFAFLSVVASATAQTTGDLGALPEAYLDTRQALRFENMLVGDGLSQSTVSDIFQDSKGFMWFATQNGLDVFDGYETRTYRPTAFDSMGLSTGWISGISEARDGIFWIATYGGGLNALDHGTGIVTRYRHDPSDSKSLPSDFVFETAQDQGGYIWVASEGGASKLDPASGTFTNFPLDTTRATPAVANTILVDSSNTVWVGTTNGLFAIDAETGKYEHYLQGLTPEPYSPSVGRPGTMIRIHEFAQDPGILWIGSGRGLIRFDKKTKAYERFVPDEAARTNVWSTFDVTQDPNDDEILWVATSGNGLARFNKRTETFQMYQRDRADPNSLVHDDVLALTTDHTGQVWVGTATGLSRFSPSSLDFVNLEITAPELGVTDPMLVWSLLADDTGSLWVATQDQGSSSFVTRLDSETGERKTWEALTRDSASPGIGLIRDLYQDEKGVIWGSSLAAVSRYNAETGSWTRRSWPSDDPVVARAYFQQMAPVQDEPGKLWLAGRGLFKFDTATGDVRTMADEGGLFTNLVDIVYDQSGLMWVSEFANGLIRLNADGSRTVYSHDPRDTTTLADNFIQDFIEQESEPGIFWLATMMGLDRFDAHVGKVTNHFTVADGLPDDVVYAVIEDNQGKIWYSTTNGIGRYDPGTGEFRNYGRESGLRQLEYNGKSAAKGPDGTIYFGHIEGITAFHPERLQQSPIPPEVALSGFRINNKPVVPGPGQPLEHPLDKTDTIHLSAAQNVFSFDFVALHYANPKANVYAYRLDGWDRDWVDAGHIRTASYTNLPAGSYTFRVKAANADGVWNETGQSINIVIHPPWWRTWWAYVSYFLLAGAVAFGLARLQRHRLGLRERERARILEAQLKADAQAKRREDAESMSEIGRAITSTFSMREIIDTVYENVNELMDAEVFAVGVYSENPPRINFPASKERGVTLPAYFHDATDMNRLSAICFQQRKELIIGDYQTEHADYVELHLPPVHGESPDSILYLPLVHHDKTIGVITAQSFQKHAYTDYHISVLRSLASYAAIALDNADAYRELASTVESLKTAQARLIQSEKLASLGEMTAGIAHEIKNPLNFVNNFAELNTELVDELVAELGDRDDLAGLLGDIRQNATQIAQHGKRADSIVRAMMQHASGGTGTREVVDANALVEEYLGLAYHGMRASDQNFNVTIVKDIDDLAGLISVVPQEIGRVLLNLLGNAFYVVRERSTAAVPGYVPTVTVGTKRRNGMVELHISDNGMGIPDNVKERIFEPFFTTKPTGSGTGLGLSLSYEIVNAHGGTLKVDSEPGQGATFTATLPAA